MNSGCPLQALYDRCLNVYIYLTVYATSRGDESNYLPPAQCNWDASWLLLSKKINK